MKKSEFIKRLEELERKVEALENAQISPLDKYFPKQPYNPYDPYRPYRRPWIEPMWPLNPWDRDSTTSPGLGTTWITIGDGGGGTTIGSDKGLSDIG